MMENFRSKYKLYVLGATGDQSGYKLCSKSSQHLVSLPSSQANANSMKLCFDIFNLVLMPSRSKIETNFPLSNACSNNY